ncbi:MAG: hypothetical protein EZS28_051032 [Streblomastix strix]|uniref:Uncharacterized protein n=1 Tax=Streblomastix strix TaxID=222440 RepID=A0A5J4T6V5_9EUKA|nr:MAG: hypothetical protein EZS28_051032 [Streblomastix strix]
MNSSKSPIFSDFSTLRPATPALQFSLNLMQSTTPSHTQLMSQTNSPYQVKSMPYIQIMSKAQDQQQNEKDTTSNSNFNSQRYNIKSIQYMQSDQNDQLMSQCNLRDLDALSPHDQNDGTLHDMNESVLP